MKYVTVFGTRPEAIKLYKIIKLLNNNLVISTGQHKELLNDTLDSLNIKPDITLNLMKNNQTLDGLTSLILEEITKELKKHNPDVVIVHGDTTTAFATALAAFYLNIKVAHVEAGLRTFNISSPFPEEANRSMIAKLATYNFAPLESNKNNLLKENVEEKKIYVTGNTVIDTLLDFSIINKMPDSLIEYQEYLKNYILVTGHRRENFGDGFENICQALLDLAKKFPQINIIYPVHLNPNVKNVVNKMLSGISNILLINPQKYTEFVYLMKNSKFILTDSGGVQEEAPSLNKPVLVMRNTTERPEAVLAGGVKIVGTDKNSILENCCELINNKDIYNKMSNIKNPYGDGLASERIINIIK